MDIKLGGRERAIIPKAVLKQIRVEDIPDNFQIEICESKDSSVIMVSVPMTFVKVGKNEFQVIYDELITRKYWDGPVGLKLPWESASKRDSHNNKHMRVNKLMELDKAVDECRRITQINHIEKMDVKFKNRK